MDAQAIETCTVDVDSTEAYTATIAIPASPYSSPSISDDHYFILVEPMNGTTVAGRTLVYEYSFSGENTISLDQASEGWTAVVSVEEDCGTSGTPPLPTGISAGGLSKKRTPPTPPNSVPIKGTCPSTPPT